MSEPLLLIEQIGAVRRIWFNREGARNAQSMRMLDELDDALVEAQNDDEVHVVILAGKGPHFSSGHDLKEGQAERAAFTVEERWDYEEKRYYDYCMRMWDFPKPIIAQVQGGCIAGGFMVANMCDLIVASEDAFFADPVVQTLAGAAVEILIHPWVLGLRKAKEMLFAGTPVGAQEAREMGMVNRVVPLDQLEAETLALAERISQASPFILRMLKKSLNRTYDAQGFRVSLSAHFDTHQLSHKTEAFKEATQSGLDGAISRGRSNVTSS